MKYPGYSLNGMSLGDISELYTPGSLRKLGGSTVLELGLYLKNYRGGRNECFMYGVDEKTK